MNRRRWTAGIALVGLATTLWLTVVPYRARIPIGRREVPGRCPSAVSAAFTRIPEVAFYDLGSGEELPDELCARSARRRLLAGAGAGLLAAAVLVAGRTTWRPGSGP
jgi:hypothetical protein